MILGAAVDKLTAAVRFIDITKELEGLLGERFRGDNLGREAEEIAKHLEGIERIVMKKFKYDIHIEVKPSEIEG